MAQAARFSIWKRGFESRWGRRADCPTCCILRGTTPRLSSLPTIDQRRALTRGALPLFSWHETQASEACCPGSIPGRGAAGRDGPIRGSYPRLRRFNSCSCNPRRLGASGGSHKAVRGGSTPPVAISFSGCGSIWQSTGSGHRGLEVRILPSRPFQQ